MQIAERDFGSLEDGTSVGLVTAIGAGGLEVSVTTYGATLVSAKFPDKSGVISEITLGFDTIGPYLGKHPFFGATVGRYANRIRDAKFRLNGTTYRLAANDGTNHLHGGVYGFNRVVWNCVATNTGDEARIRFTYTSPDGDEGYPGELAAAVTYVVGDDNTLRFEYQAVPTAPTPINLTNHTYWNLESPGSDVRNHCVKLNAHAYLGTDEGLIPDGRVISVAGTPFDFSSSKTLLRDFDEAGGYDTNFILDGTPGTVREAAVVHVPSTGRRMIVSTDQPAIQLYSANMLDEIVGHEGVTYRRYGAMCLETGGYNDSVNNDSFPSTIVSPGEEYSHTTVHTFSIV